MDLVQVVSYLVFVYYYCFLLQEISKLFDGLDVFVFNYIQFFYEFWNENSNFNNVLQYFVVNIISYINIVILFFFGFQKSNGSIVVVLLFVVVVFILRIVFYCGNKGVLYGFFNSLRQDLVL